MADHFFVDKWIRREGYTWPGKVKANFHTPNRDRSGHGAALKNKFFQAWQIAKHRKRSVAVISGTPDGFYIQFESDPDFSLDLEKLDLRSQGIELATVKQQGNVQLATVFVPEGKVQFFLDRFEDYLTKETKSGKPKNRTLVDSIGDIRLATLESLWAERQVSFPQDEQSVWWEIWLRKDNGHEIERFLDLSRKLGLITQPGYLSFLDRTVVVCRATPTELAQSLDMLNDFGELRLAKEVADFFLELNNADQVEWAKDLQGRLQHAPLRSPTVCVLDSGVNRAHTLLSESLHEGDLHAYSPQWGVADFRGHGTEMAGLALYGDLAPVLATRLPVILTHRLESVKILPNVGANDPQLYGLITKSAAAQVEVTDATRKRIFLMAVTAIDQRDRGRPSSWSAAIDELAAGVDDLSSEHRRLYILSAGNRTTNLTRNYFEDSILDSIHDPAQSWNAIAVGAFTEKAMVSEEAYQGWELLAQPGQLSADSTSSRMWQSQWPIKPDIVMEGGNEVISPAGEITSPDSLSLVTTYHQTLVRQFSSTSDTSAASALAARMSATIQARYPSIWPETIRAILVHSARWLPAMRAQATDTNLTEKQNIETLLRCFGYGVPSLDRALESTSNALTLIAEETIFPFEKDKTKEMILHELPWPKDALLSLGATEVEMRVTLSYFIEPNPAERGWTRRHRYASHGLRFDVKTALEKTDQFRARLNKQAREEDETGTSSISDAREWLLGPKLRIKGSVHSDVWTGTATELANRGIVGVYPVSGWWKERHQLGRSSRGARYSLIVSIETPPTEVNIYAPVQTQIETKIETLIDI